MESTKNTKKKPSNPNPANQSTLAFTATSSMMSNSLDVKAPYDSEDKVATVFQLAFTLLELAALGDIAVHRGPLNVKANLPHCHTFSQRGDLLAAAQKKFLKEFQVTREEAQELDNIESKDFGRLTMHVVGRYTSLMRMQPMQVITADNLHLVQVVMSAVVNTRDAPLPKRFAFHIVPPYYFDPALLNAQDWEVLRSDSMLAHPEVLAMAGKEFKILGEILLAQPAFEASSKVMKSKSKTKDKEDSWGSP